MENIYNPKLNLSVKQSELIDLILKTPNDGIMRLYDKNEWYIISKNRYNVKIDSNVIIKLFIMGFLTKKEEYKDKTIVYEFCKKNLKYVEGLNGSWI